MGQLLTNSKTSYDGYWQPDNSSSVCAVCEKEFTFVNRRHHCRQCGHLVCSSCGEYSAHHVSNHLSRVCTSCIIDRLNFVGKIREIAYSLDDLNKDIDEKKFECKQDPTKKVKSIWQACEFTGVDIHKEPTLESEIIGHIEVGELFCAFASPGDYDSILYASNGRWIQVSNGWINYLETYEHRTGPAEDIHTRISNINNIYEQTGFATSNNVLCSSAGFTIGELFILEKTLLNYQMYLVKERYYSKIGDPVLSKSIDKFCTIRTELMKKLSDYIPFVHTSVSNNIEQFAKTKQIYISKLNSSTD